MPYRNTIKLRTQ